MKLPKHMSAPAFDLAAAALARLVDSEQPRQIGQKEIQKAVQTVRREMAAADFMHEVEAIRCLLKMMRAVSITPSETPTNQTEISS